MEIPVNLETKILASIQAVRQKDIQKGLRIRIFLFGGLSVASLASIFVSGQHFFTSVSQSGLYEYFSVIFSDVSTLSIIWKEFAITFVESLPVVGAVTLLAAITLFLWSLMRTSRVYTEMRPGVINTI